MHTIFALNISFNIIPCRVSGSKDERLPILWLAPESILKSDFTVKSDVYSLGHACLEVLSHGLFPFTEHPNKSLAGKLKEVFVY